MKVDKVKIVFSLNLYTSFNERVVGLLGREIKTKYIIILCFLIRLSNSDKVYSDWT